jgi:predicted nucleotidyltransferase
MDAFPNKTLIIQTLQAALPHLLAIYVFGSQAQNTAGRDSDLDIAILLAGRADPLSLWELAQQLANQVGCEVDLIDLRSASTVMQYQIICSDKLLWAKDAQAAIFESFILSEKTALDTLRAGLIEDIQNDGSIYDR